MLDTVYISIPPIWFTNYLDHIEYRSTNDPYRFIDTSLILLGLYIKNKYNAIYFPEMNDPSTSETISKLFVALNSYYGEGISYVEQIHCHYYDRLFDFLLPCFKCINRPIIDIGCYLDDQGNLTGFIID